MNLRKDQFPITIQAFELKGSTELFIAEQVVNNQADVDAFSARYAGKIIKAKAVTTTTASTTTTTTTRDTTTYKRKSSSGAIALIILLILAALIAYGFYTGWIQRTTGISF
jgi:uncharacterized protein HemX